MIQAMNQDLPKPIEGSSSEYFKFIYTGNKFFKILNNTSSVKKQTHTLSEEEQINVLSELLSKEQLSEKDLIVTTCFTIFHQQSTLASYLINTIKNIHKKIEKFSVVNQLPNRENAFKEYHYKWAPLCFAVVKWNQPIIEALRNKGASIKDIKSSQGFLGWLTSTVGIEDRDYRLSILGQMGFLGFKKTSETDSLL